MGDSFLTYRGGRWFWVFAVSTIALTSHYLHHRSQTPPYGGSTVGLVYGLLATVIIGVLMYLGIRKRSYASHVGTLQGWVSSHVYLGLLTAFLVPMHAGFRFGRDIHTLAFVLLSIVVLSGIVGVALYRYIPVRLTKYESGMQADKIDKEISQLLVEMRNLVKDKSDSLVQLYKEEVAKVSEMKTTGWSLFFRRAGDEDLLSQRGKELADKIVSIPSEDQAAFQLLSRLLLQKSQLEINLINQIRLRNAMQAWLFIHVPVSIAMVVTVGIHIVVVFYY